MKIINPVISFILSILFLKEYNFNEEKTRRIKNKALIFAFIWGLFMLFFIFPLPNILGNFSGNTGFQLQILLFLFFSIYHWFILIYISRFAKKHIAYLALLLPMVFVIIWNLILWNKPTYYGAMDGFASIGTFLEQLLMLIIFPTFLFALRMMKIENQFKGWLLIFITFTSAVLGIKQCIGKEGYLSDSTGNIFVFLTICLFAIAFLLFRPANLKKV